MYRLLKTLNRTALIKATIAALAVIIVVFVGSRNLQHFDAALIAYLFGTVFAVFGVAYRYSVWVQRPPTKLYWRRSWQFLLSKDFVKYALHSIKLLFKNILLQRFIYPRGRMRWWGHFMLASGCLLAFAVTIPLTFGWVHFTLEPDSLTTYNANFFGFPVSQFELGSPIAFVTFHALVWCSVFVTIGAVIMLKRRLTHGGLIATQTFEGDWLRRGQQYDLSPGTVVLLYDETGTRQKTVSRAEVHIINDHTMFGPIITAAGTDWVMQIRDEVAELLDQEPPPPDLSDVETEYLLQEILKRVDTTNTDYDFKKFKKEAEVCDDCRCVKILDPTEEK
jgi:hypothetical protein